MTSLLVSLFPSATLPWVNLPITEQASSLASVNQTSVCLPKETIASLTLRVFSKPDSTRNSKSGVGAQPASAKYLPNQASIFVLKWVYWGWDPSLYVRICPRGTVGVLLLGCHFAVCHGPGNRAPLVYDQPPCKPFSVSHAALGKFADNFSLSPKRDNRFPDFESVQQARLHKESQPASAKCLPNQAGMTG